MTASRGRIARFGRRGIAAIEFALVMPVVLFLFLASTDVVRFLIFVDQARRAAIIAADGGSENAVISPSLMLSILQQVQTQVSPSLWSSAPTTNGMFFSVVVSNALGIRTLLTQVKYPATLTASSSFGCRAGTTGGLLSYGTWEANDTYLVAEVFYTFKPFIFAANYFPSISTLSIHDYAYYRPRLPASFPSVASTC